MRLIDLSSNWPSKRLDPTLDWNFDKSSKCMDKSVPSTMSITVARTCGQTRTGDFRHSCYAPTTAWLTLSSEISNHISRIYQVHALISEAQEIYKNSDKAVVYDCPQKQRCTRAHLAFLEICHVLKKIKSRSAKQPKGKHEGVILQYMLIVEAKCEWVALRDMVCICGARVPQVVNRSSKERWQNLPQKKK